MRPITQRNLRTLTVVKPPAFSPDHNFFGPLTDIAAWLFHAFSQGESFFPPESLYKGTVTTVVSNINYLAATVITQQLYGRQIQEYPDTIEKRLMHPHLLPEKTGDTSVWPQFSKGLEDYADTQHVVFVDQASLGLAAYIGEELGIRQALRPILPGQAYYFNVKGIPPYCQIIPDGQILFV